MPKRTKRQKILADRRKSQDTISPVKTERENKNPVQTPSGYGYTFSKDNEKPANTVKPVSGISLENFPAVRRDLVKTALFAVLTLIIEMVIINRLGHLN